MVASAWQNRDQPLYTIAHLQALKLVIALEVSRSTARAVVLDLRANQSCLYLRNSSMIDEIGIVVISLHRHEEQKRSEQLSSEWPQNDEEAWSVVELHKNA